MATSRILNRDKPRGKRGLHVEAEGCIVNIYESLRTGDGRNVTSVEIICDHYAGEAPWELEGRRGKYYYRTRLIERKKRGKR